MPSTATAARVDIREKRITINWTLVIILAVLTVTCGGLAVWRYRDQSASVAHTYYEDAQKQLESEDWRGAVDTLYRYLRFEPKDELAWYDLATAYSNMAQDDRQVIRAIGLHYQAIGLATSENRKAELSERLAELHLDLGQLDQAKQAALDAQPKDIQRDTTKAERIRAIAEFRLGVVDRNEISDKVIDDLRISLNKNPGDVELATMAAIAIRDSDAGRAPSESDILAADQIMEELLAFEENRTKSSAWLARHAYRREYGSKAGADEDLQQAITQASDAQDKLRAGIAALQWAPNSSSSKDKWLEEAVALLSEVVDDKRVVSIVAYVQLGAAYSAQGNLDKAIETWTAGVEQFPRRSIDLRIQLARAHLRQNQTDEAEKQIVETHKLVDQLAGMVNQYESRRHLVNIENTVELLDAEWLLATGKPEEAIQSGLSLLASVAPGSAEESLVRYSAYLLLGHAYRRTGEWRDAANAYDAADDEELDDGFAAQQAGRIRHEQGNTVGAVKVVQRAAERLQDAVLWFTVAELHYDKQVSIPVDEQDWGDFDVALDRANKIDSSTWHTPFWNAARAAASDLPNSRDQALKLLGETESIGPEDPIAWYRLALAYQDLDAPEKADAARREFESRDPPQWQASMLEARLAAQRGRIAAAILLAEQAVAQGPDQAEPPRRLVQFLLANGDSVKARDTMEEMYRKSTDDLELLQDLAELDLLLRNFDKVEQWESELKNLEGQHGVNWRLFKARRLLAQQPSVANLGDASELQQQIERQRRAWAPGWILKGDIYMRYEQFGEAAACYKRAESLGARNLGVYERLLTSLYRSQQYEDATRYMKQLEQVIPNSGRLFDLSSAVLSQTDQIPDAIERAKLAVEKDATDAKALIWLAQLHVLNGQNREAEDALARAVRLESNELAPWLALFQFCSQRRPQLAAKVLKRIEKQKNELSSEQYALTVGQGWEQLGNTERADKIYVSAIKMQPNNVDLRLVRARMLFTSNPEEAERELRKAREIDSKSVPARQLLATLLAIRGGQADWEEGKQLLSPDRLGTGETHTDARLRAVLLTHRGDPKYLKDARETLEQLIQSSGAATPVDRLLLANACESEGDFAAARAQYEALCENSAVPGHLVAIIRFLIRNNHADEAETWVESLDAATRASRLSDRLLFLSTKARWQAAMSRTDETEQMLESFANITESSLSSEDDKKELYRGLGQIYSSVQLHQQAETWYRKLLDVDKSSFRTVAIGLAHVNKHSEAIDLVIANLGSDPQEIALLDSLINVLSAGQPDDQAWQETESIWSAAESDQSDNILIPMFASAARAMQGREDQAIEIMSALQIAQPDNPLVLNNLATLLGQTEGRQTEALAYVDRAVEIAGPRPSLLDTQSAILVEMGKAEDAVKRLKHLEAIPQPDPRILLRLAVAHMRSNSPGDATSVYQRALAAGLESQVLTKRDRELMKELSEL